jgi:hypothetical protein
VITPAVRLGVSPTTALGQLPLKMLLRRVHSNRWLMLHSHVSLHPCLVVKADTTELLTDAVKVSTPNPVYAVRTMRFPTTTGLDAPRPGSSVFQTMFSESLQVVGGSESGAVALPEGRRNCGQSFALLVEQMQRRTVTISVRAENMD